MRMRTISTKNEKFGGGMFIHTDSTGSLCGGPAQLMIHTASSCASNESERLRLEEVVSPMTSPANSPKALRLDSGNFFADEEEPQRYPRFFFLQSLTAHLANG